MKTGKVFLVGAGPGDVSLITVKGMESIKQAEVILYDRLANPKLLDFAPADCELIYCGKLPDRHILRQEKINSLLVEKALEGKTVVRLKGGDPGVFGRVGEEAQSLVEFNIPFEIVPGISSGIAAPLYAGIPVTHREFAESFAVVTAHDKSKEGKPLLDWEGLVRGVDTIAFYMGVGNLPFICENLIQHGKPAETPVILIQWGTFGRQKTLQGTLIDIAEKAVKEQFSNPSIILVGEVVSLREKLKWFENKPLYGRQILFARTSTGQSSLAKELMEQGADVIEFPKWKRVSVAADLGKAIAAEKILFTSTESAEEFFKQLIEKDMDVRRITAEFYVLSGKTKRFLNSRGFVAKVVEEVPGSGNLLVVGDASILNTTQYGSFEPLITVKKEIDQSYNFLFKRMLEEAEVNTVLFPSAASVKPFLKEIESAGLNVDELFAGAEVACLGNETRKEIGAAGLKMGIIPAEPTKDSLIKSLQY